MKSFIRRVTAMLRLAVNDFKAAYSGSVFGALWAVAEPLVTVLVYWFVYTVAFGGQSINGVPYYLWLSVGIAPWFFVSNGINGVTMCFRDYSFLVKKLRFDKACLPFVRTASAFISHLIFTAIVLTLCAASGVCAVKPLLLLAAMCMAVVLVYSVGRICALVCAAFKDMKNIVSVVLSVGFWLTPVFWSAAAPQGIASLVWLNPAAVTVELYRAAIIGGAGVPSVYVLYAAVLCAVLLVLGELYEKKALPAIADRL